MREVRDYKHAITGHVNRQTGAEPDPRCRTTAQRKDIEALRRQILRREIRWIEE